MPFRQIACPRTEGIRHTGWMMVGAGSAPATGWPMAISRFRQMPRSAFGPGLVVIAMLAALAATHASAQTPQLTSIVPNSGPIGTEVTIRGSGFTVSGNTVIFGVGSRAYPSGSVYPNHSSDNGSVIRFTIPEHYDPACEYSSRPCPYAALPTMPGSYSVAVSNIGGQSNAQNFTVTAQ
jgi:hypothetical protein